MYSEKLTPLKVVAFGLVVVSIFFLSYGQVIEKRAFAANPAKGE
jgi:hypothetical protein